MASAPRVGFLWGDFPWHRSPRKVGKLLSVGAVSRNMTKALSASADVLPYTGRADDERELAAFLRSVDVLWADLYPHTEPALRVRRALGLDVPAVLWAGGTMPKAAEPMLLGWRELVRPGDGLLFSCEADREIWRRLASRSRLREWVAPLAVDDSVFHARQGIQRDAIRRDLGVPEHAPLLLYVGRLNIQKGLHLLVGVLEQVTRRHPTAHLCLVGEEDDIVLGEFEVRNDGYLDLVRRLAERTGVAGRITLGGPLFGTDLASAYAAADVAVNASVYHRENFGMSQAEAQACGTPVVCTAWGGFKDVVAHGETGYLIDAVLTRRGIRVDRLTAAEHVCALLEDRALHDRMATAAAALASERFGMDRFARTLGDVVGDARSLTPQGTEGPPYELSPFAQAYERRKRDAGWYGADPMPRGLFAGEHYELYRTMMRPYATRTAEDTHPQDIAASWVPRPVWPLHLDHRMRSTRCEDPIWPHERTWTDAEWPLVSLVDGLRSVGDLARARPQLPDPRETLLTMQAEGFALLGPPPT